MGTLTIQRTRSNGAPDVMFVGHADTENLEVTTEEVTETRTEGDEEVTYHTGLVVTIAEPTAEGNTGGMTGPAGVTSAAAQIGMAENAPAEESAPKAAKDKAEDKAQTKKA